MARNFSLAAVLVAFSCCAAFAVDPSISNNKNSEFEENLRAKLALLGDEPSKASFLADRLLTAKAEEVPGIVRFMSPYKVDLNERLWQAVKGDSWEQRLRAGAALAEFDPENDAWKKVKSEVATALVSVPIVEAKQWIDLLRPVGTQLIEPLDASYRDSRPKRAGERALALAVLADYLKSDPQKLTQLILVADNQREFLLLLHTLRPHHELATQALLEVLSQSPRPGAPKTRDAFWKQQANAAVCLFELGELEAVWPLLKQAPNPSQRSFIIDRLALLGADHQILAAHLIKEANPSIQQALILSLAEFDADRTSSEQRQNMVDQLANLYRTNSDPGVHSAAAWTMKQWNEDDVIKRIDAELHGASSQNQRKWFINSQGLTFSVVDAPGEFLMGDRVQEKVTLSHRFAIAANELTIAQFRKFRPTFQHMPRFPAVSDWPVTFVIWYEAVEYCNWLSEQEGIPKDQWCYEPNDKGQYDEGMNIPADFLQRSGYRLPTEVEWEYACRANTNTSYCFGEPVELLDRYAWYRSNSQNRMGPFQGLTGMGPVGFLRPNVLGLFDMHGDVREWCHDLWDPKNNERIEVIDTNKEDGVLRGGSFSDQPESVRSASRSRHRRQGRGSYIGFRPARTYP